MTYSVPRMRPTDRHTNRSGTSRQNQRLRPQNSRLRMARAPREFPEVEGGVAFEVDFGGEVPNKLQQRSHPRLPASKRLRGPPGLGLPAKIYNFQPAETGCAYQRTCVLFSSNNVGTDDHHSAGGSLSKSEYTLSIYTSFRHI